MKGKYLLDASALLSLIRNEPGADRVKAVLDDSEIHAANLAEVVRKLISKGMPPAEAEELLEDMNLNVIEELNRKQAYAVGRLTSKNQPLGFSLGDAVCLAIAEWHGITAVTADRR